MVENISYLRKINDTCIVDILIHLYLNILYEDIRLQVIFIRLQADKAPMLV